MPAYQPHNALEERLIREWFASQARDWEARHAVDVSIWRPEPDSSTTPPPPGVWHLTIRERALFDPLTFLGEPTLTGRAWLEDDEIAIERGDIIGWWQLDAEHGGQSNRFPSPPVHPWFSARPVPPAESLSTGALVEWRARLGMSQADLARALGVHLMTVSKWERGVHEIPGMVELACRELLRERA